MTDPWWTSNPRRQGGKPCYAGTRIPVATIHHLLADRTPEQVHGMYPDLTIEQIELAREPLVQLCGCDQGAGHVCEPFGGIW